MGRIPFLDVKRRLKHLPFQLGKASLLILVGVAEGIIAGSVAILDGPGTGLKKQIRSLEKRNSIFDSFNEVFHVKSAHARVILHRLQEKGLVEKNNTRYVLTSLGTQYYQCLKAAPSKERWDGKWRLIMFDIPERMKRERTWFRNQLFSLGYITLQKSVFIGKQPLHEDLFKEILRKNMRDFIRIVTIGEIDDEKILDAFR